MGLNHDAVSFVSNDKDALTPHSMCSGLHQRSVPGVGSSPALATCETSQVLLAGVSGGFSQGSPVFAPPTDWPVSYELK